MKLAGVLTLDTSVYFLCVVTYQALEKLFACAPVVIVQPPE